MLDISHDIHKILRKVTEDEGFQKPISQHEKRKKLALSIGDVFFVKLRDEQSKKIRDVVVKKGTDVAYIRIIYRVSQMYLNECKFYDYLMPTFRKFQKTFETVSVYNEIPKCYATSMIESKEIVVLEDLRYCNFKSIKRGTFLNKTHFELIFSRYGKFHGISLAYKTKFPETFKNMTNDLFDYWGNIIHKNIDQEIKSLLQECEQYVMLEPDNKLVEKFQEFVSKEWEGCIQSYKYPGGHSVLLHGDSSGNNIMFKYDKKKKPNDIRFIDFKIVRLGTPVFDLSYCLYSTAKREVFEELDHHLKIYHDSLSKTVKKYECDVEKLYPFDLLTKEWKTYCKFGFIMSLQYIRDTWNICSRGDVPLDDPSCDKNCTRHAGEVKKRYLDIIKHMYKRGFL